jgi:rubredoxin
MALAAIAAVAAVGIRRWLRSRTARQRPGANLQRAVPVTRFDEIDAVLEGRLCRCGAPLRSAGETSRVSGNRRFRVVRILCPECERDEKVYFDVTRVFH